MCMIGLTGSFATGKSTVAGLFKGFGAKVINTDAIAHQLMSPKGSCYRKIIREFGRDILTAGRVDRRKLAAIVFRDFTRLRKLERMIHPEVRKTVNAKIRQIKQRRQKSVIIAEVPLLFESKLHKDMDISICVKASRTAQMKRAKNLGFTGADALRRIKAQMSLRKKIRLADIIIDNDGSITNTKKQVKQIWEKL